MCRTIQQWADWSIGQLRAQAKIHELVINAVVYAELSVSFSTIELLNRTIATMQLTLRDIPTPALFLFSSFVVPRRD